MSFLQKAFFSLAALGGIWAVFLGTLLNPRAQRFALYANYFHSAFWDNLDDGQEFGFMPNQVRPLNISKPSGGHLYAWHVLPLSLYSKHEVELRHEHQNGFVQYADSLAYKYLIEEPTSHVVINFHGNAGHLANGWRAESYKIITSAAPAHVIAFDYSGFGRSSGSPSEKELISDGETVLDYVVNHLKIPPHRITLLGQSLGTAVATAAALHWRDADASLQILPGYSRDLDDRRSAKSTSDEAFASIILTSSFSDIPTLMKTYRILGIVPILSPLRFYPRIEEWIVERIQDTWYTKARIETLVRSHANANGIGKLRLHLIHAKNDFQIPFRHSQALFYAAANASKTGEILLTSLNKLEEYKNMVVKGRLTWTWGTSYSGRNTGDDSMATEGEVEPQESVSHGGHNKIAKGRLTWTVRTMSSGNITKGDHSTESADRVVMEQEMASEVTLEKIESHGGGDWVTSIAHISKPGGPEELISGANSSVHNAGDNLMETEGELILEILSHGGHNKITASAPIALAVARSLNGS